MGNTEGNCCSSGAHYSENDLELAMDNDSYRKYRDAQLAADILEQQQYYATGPLVLFIKNIDILDYEARVKRYVDQDAKGNVSEEQLKLSFKDLQTFDNLDRKDSVLHKLLFSPFVTKVNTAKTPRVNSKTGKEIPIKANREFFSFDKSKEGS